MTETKKSDSLRIGNTRTLQTHFILEEAVIAKK